ncbi:efflux RND transporter periplasmic adaptor subunit [Rhodoferax sp. GW822-FHT02A01]|uniref:efflux RND transporter periplasmic adaptor subunit n=1 Tax=Rhodoferax sp. GW822-FHT02A01 TaxID=3141537 RepID=UPI00315DEB51
MSLTPYRIGLLLVSAVFALSACSKPEPKEEPLRAVKVMTVGESSLLSSVEYSGEVRSRVESQLGFRVGGKIIRRAVELGQHVKAGQVLAQLDAQDLKLSLDAARAQLASAATNRDLAAADFKRYKELREQNFISSAELERRETTLKSAQAQWDQAQAQMTGQGNQAGYAVLVADASGVVTSVDAEVGQVVAAGTPVIRIAQDGPRDVVFSVPEDKVRAVSVGSTAKVRLWPGNTVLPGTVREVAASADPVTRTYLVKVALDGKPDVQLGATVAVTAAAFEHGDASVIKVPTSALLKDGNQSAVWVLDTATMTVRLNPVGIATADGNDVVISSGLQPGAKVVVAGVHVLAPGQKVMLYQPRQQEANAVVTPAAAK